jgi:hypothetical protein
MVQTNSYLGFVVAFVVTILLCYILLQFSYFIFFVFPPVMLLCFFPLKLWKHKGLVGGIVLGYITSFIFI